MNVIDLVLIGTVSTRSDSRRVVSRVDLPVAHWLCSPAWTAASLSEVFIQPDAPGAA